jgi:Pro-kumamolisin, activation domain/Subtilase family
MSIVPIPSRTSVRSWLRPALIVVIALMSVGSGLLISVPFASAAPVAPAAVLGSPATASGLLTGTQLQNSPFATSPGTPLQTLVNGSVEGPVPDSSPVSFTIGFQLQNQSLLEQILTEQQTPGSPLFHQWLTGAEEAQMFGPNPVVVQNTVNYFTSLGFQVATQGPLSVSFKGPAAQVNSAFKTQLVNVKLGSGAEGMLNSEPLSLPSAIAGSVASVNGLDTTTVAHVEHFIDPSALSDIVDASQLPTTALGTALASQNWVNISQAYNYTNHAFLWFQYFSHSQNRQITWQTLTPAALNVLYNGTQLLDQGYNGDSTGTPIRIAIVMAGGINPGDIKGYGQLVFNNPNAIWNRLVPMPIDGSFTTNGTLTYTDGDSGEMALDIEYSATMALGATIMPVYGPCLCTNVLDDDYAAIDALPQSQLPNIISNSWGGEEDTFGNLYGPNWQNSLTMHYYFMLLDARGSTVIASSGDGGGLDWNGQGDSGTGVLSGSFPATDPYVLSVNGVRTSASDPSGAVFPKTDTIGLANVTIYTLHNWPVHVESATQISYQSFWYQPTSNKTLYNAPPEASGGFGTSYWFNQSWFEHGIGVPDLGRSLGSGVSAEADFNQSIFFDGGWEFLYGGTSFACPTTAGELALIEDYLSAHGHGSFLGDGNVPAYWVANAFWNGNLTLVPYYDIKSNGTSYWGNFAVSQGYSWPPGQKFPHAAQGWTVYGNTTRGWDFPTGWGTINVYNFARDLNILESMPGTVMTLNTAASAFDVGKWSNMVLNQTYTIHLNASTAFAASNPVVTVKFMGADGVNSTLQPALTAAIVPTSGLNFQLDTSISPFDTPGLIFFEVGNSTTHSAGFAYTWISYPIPAGNLTVKVVSPGESAMVGGYAQFNPWPFGYDAPIQVSPSCCTYPNTFTVQVTFQGRPVYDAQVDAMISDPTLLAWQDSKIQGATDSLGKGSAYLSSPIVSQTFTNLSGFALVNTWNVISPTSYTVTATYGTASASTTYGIVPGPNVGTSDNYGGNYSQINTIAFVLKQLRQPVNNQTLDLWAPNSVNQSAYYNMLYTWAGELLPVHTNNYQGNPLAGLHVWFGNMDLGGENKFYHYVPSFGAVGVTNTSGTSAVTDANGNAMIYIPQNESLNFYVYPNGTDFSGFGYISASIPGAVNRTFSYTSPCGPLLPNTKLTITCQFNDSFERNYTSVPAIVLPDPVKAWTQTTSLVARDFFGVGAKINAGVQVNLPNNDPWISGFGYAWSQGVEHVVDAKAYVDGVYAGDLTPDVPPDWQNYNSSVNLTGTYSPGIHVLEIVVNDSVGHIFTARHTFVVGAITFNNLGTANTYTQLPYNMTWTLDIPAAQVSNHTFNQTLDIRYVSGGCGGSGNPCPSVVNYTERIRDGVVDYYQLLNLTLLNLEHFYGGSSQLPSGQYQIILWLNANHSGSIAAQVNTYLVFEPVQMYLNGPTANQTVPLGNVTISYSYSGQYIESANLSVFTATDLSVPIFNVLALVPGDGLRGGAASWTAVKGGPYVIQLSLGTPYSATDYSIRENVSVVETAGLVYLNQSSGQQPIGHMNPAATAVVLTLVGAVLGLLVGVWAAPAFRRTTAGGPAGPKAASRPWEEGQDGKGAAIIRCPVCKDEFSTEFALHQHQKIVHGIEE